MMIFLSIVFFVFNILLPLINLGICTKEQERFSKCKEIRRFFMKTANWCSNPCKLKDFRKKNIFAKIDSQKWMIDRKKKEAKKAYSRFITSKIIYCLLIIVSLSSCIGMLVFDLCFLGDNIAWGIFSFAVDLICLWILSLSDMFRFLGAISFADKIDDILHKIFEEEIYASVSKMVVHISVFLINLSACCGLYYITIKILQFANFNLEGESKGLVFMCTFFLAYRYIVIPLVTLPLCKIAGHFTKERVANIDCNEFVIETLKNSTYMVYLIIFFLYKVELGTSVDANIAEAIGIVFLLDTYIDKQKQIELKWSNALITYMEKKQEKEETECEEE